uniref:Related to nadp-dependent malic enzyme n=1 Tax=Melanopsichium pennsylvanicum 4 TaxID=1398559 RepID=A0A077RB10_9BASI|nr:related to nadp-dependent malic enzyme [Melanopsichium pennsylvanicum 4]
MAPSVSDVRAVGVSMLATKNTQVTPDDKITEDPRDSNLHRAIHSHPMGGAANLRDVFTNQGE